MLGLESRVKPSCAKILAVATWTGGNDNIPLFRNIYFSQFLTHAFSKSTSAKKKKKEHPHQRLTPKSIGCCLLQAALPPLV